MVHKNEIFVASIPIQEQKEEALSMSRKCKNELEDLKTGVKYHKIYHAKKGSMEDKGEMIIPAKESKQKRRKE